MLVWFLPLVAGVAGGSATVMIWLIARPSPTAAAIVALSTFGAVLAGDLIAGARSKMIRTAGLWQATSRIGLAGATLGIAVAGITQADLSLLLTVLACGAAFVTAVRAASSEYETFTVRQIEAAFAELPDGAAESLAKSFARVRNLSLAVALGAAIYVLYPAQRWPGLDGLIPIAVLWILFVGIPRRLAKTMTGYELSLRGISTVERPLDHNPSQLSLDLFPEERPPEPERQAARLAETQKQRETASAQSESQPPQLAGSQKHNSEALGIGLWLLIALGVMFVALMLAVFVVDYVSPNWISSQENRAAHWVVSNAGARWTMIGLLLLGYCWWGRRLPKKAFGALRQRRSKKP